jgi:hypothetical protein
LTVLGPSILEIARHNFSGLTSLAVRRIKRVAGSGGARGDLGQLAPRKKLLKSLTGFPELSETLLALFGTEGFLFSASALPLSLTTLHILGQDCHPEANHEVC